MADSISPVTLHPADILIPNEDIDLNVWCSVPCDQYTSEPDKWEEIEFLTQEAPSSNHIVFPEIYLGQKNQEKQIRNIRRRMEQYLEDGLFINYPHSFILTRRIRNNAVVRTGLVGMIDLEEYDYHIGSGAPIRATEKTVSERIPPRKAIRDEALIELPHVILLMDDPEKTIIEPLEKTISERKPLYRAELMLDGGIQEGYLLSEEETERIEKAIGSLTDPVRFAKRYHLPMEMNLAFAVGDGNHSLASAKASYESVKAELGDAARELPIRYALVELVNLYDENMIFHPIHRLVKGNDFSAMMEVLQKELTISEEPVPGSIQMVGTDRPCYLFAAGGPAECIAALDHALSEYKKDHSIEIDYIHGDDTLKDLSDETDTIGFLSPIFPREDLFPAVIRRGILPRKCFSIGIPEEKRYYLEARKIR